MSRKVTFFTIIKPFIWIPFFFANQTIIFSGIVFGNIGKCKGMFIIFVLNYERKCCTFKTQGEITSSAYKYPCVLVIRVIVITSIAILIRTYRKEEGVLVTIMFQDCWNWTTLNVKIKMTFVTSIGEAVTRMATSVTNVYSTGVRCIWVEGEHVMMKYVILLFW